MPSVDSIRAPRQLSRYARNFRTRMTETIICKFCGQILSGTATECTRCGAGTPYGVALADQQDALESSWLQRYEYDMVQIPPNITVKQATGNDAAIYLQRIVNEHASRG